MALSFFSWSAFTSEWSCVPLTHDPAEKKYFIIHLKAAQPADDHWELAMKAEEATSLVSLIQKH